MKYKSTDGMVLILAMDNYFYVCFFTREPESQFAPHLETRPTIFIMSMVLCAGTLDDCCFEYEEISGSNRPLFEGAYVCRHAVIIHRVNSYTTLPSGPLSAIFVFQEDSHANTLCSVLEDSDATDITQWSVGEISLGERRVMDSGVKKRHNRRIITFISRNVGPNDGNGLFLFGNAVYYSLWS